MLGKTFFLGLFALTTLFLFAQTSQAEARRHCRSHTGLHVNVGTAYNNTYVVRRYAAPVAVPAVVYVPQVNYAPYYQVVAPTYVEEVYVERAPRSIGFGGLSFSWNFFK